MVHHSAASLPAVWKVYLLYPLAEEPVDVALTLKGQIIRVRTINLEASWKEIHDQLIILLQDPKPLPPVEGIAEQSLRVLV